MSIGTIAATPAALPRPGHATHVRWNQSLLAEPERRLLVWMAKRLPHWINSDHLTLLALVAMVGTGATLAFAATAWIPWLVALALSVNWFGDSLDGTLARVRQQLRPRYGYYVDHVVDMLGAIAVVAGLAASGWMTPVVALAALAAWLLLFAETFLATHAAGTFRMSFALVGPTEVRILLAIGVARAAHDPTVPVLGQRWMLFDVAGTCMAAGALAIFVVSAIRTARELATLEPRPPVASREFESGATSR